MTAKELIRILQIMEPDTTVTFSVGRNDEYRALCARAELATVGSLGYMTVDKIDIYPDDEIMIDIVLKSASFDLEGEASEFDRKYTKIEEDDV